MNIHTSRTALQHSRAQQSVASLAGSTVLLVEDSRHISDAVRLICRAFGVRMRRAGDLGTARRHLGLYRPDAVLVDPGLPDGCGIALIGALARQRPRIPLLIALSGLPEHEQAARAAGADDFISKAALSPDRLCAALGGLPGLTVDDAKTIAPHGQVGDDACIAPPPGSLQRLWGRARRPRATESSVRLPVRVGQPDPAALRDDLRLICDLLSGAQEPRRIDFAAGLARGIAGHLGDDAMLRASEQMARSGSGRELLELLRARMAESGAVWAQ